MLHPIIVTISHELSREEAKSRLDAGLAQIRRQLAPFAHPIDYRWTGYRLDFGLTAVRQSISGHIDVEERMLRIELVLPPLLRVLSRLITGRVRSEGSRLLEKPAE